MEDASQNREQAEKFLSDGDYEKGVPLLLKSLDIEPSNLAAIEDLETAAALWPKWTDDLFKRVDNAVTHAGTPGVRRRVAWRRLTYAVLFDRMDLARHLTAPADDAILADPQLRVAVGALLVEMGNAREGMNLLVASDLPIAQYHLARFQYQKGDLAGAKMRLAKLSGNPATNMVRDIGLAFLGIETPDGIKRAKDLLATPRETLVASGISPLVHSEMIILSVRIALKEGRRDEAATAAEELGRSPQLQDPSAMLRAKALVGPLWQL